MTECCGAMVYSVTHRGSFCAYCDRKVYLNSGLLVTPQRDQAIWQGLAMEVP